MLICFTSDLSSTTVPITPITSGNFAAWLKDQPERNKNLVAINNFSAKPDSFCLLTDANGNLQQALLGMEDNDDFFAFGVLPAALPKGDYKIIAPDFTPDQFEHAAIAWGMGSYQFTRYKKQSPYQTKLYLPENDTLINVDNIVSTIFWVRDLINTPAEDLDPERLAEQGRQLALEFNAEFKMLVGEELRHNNFPAVYVVGRGSVKPPVVFEINYSAKSAAPTAPKIALVGKGVCFDSGGLNLKTSANMALMKKDMAGAAHALGLARLIMQAELPVHLRVIVPAVENLVSGAAYKPGDIIATRQGLQIEITNTDAEGRLILADALTYASEWQPDLVLDFATLTGAARVALGTDILAMFTPNDQLAEKLTRLGNQEQEPVWRLPLFQDYLKSCNYSAPILTQGFNF